MRQSRDKKIYRHWLAVSAVIVAMTLPLVSAGAYAAGNSGKIALGKTSITINKKGGKKMTETHKPVETVSKNKQVYPKHKPYGKGIGAKPGRVVWSHNPKSVSWDGKGYWWKTEHFDEKIIMKMFRKSIASLGGEKKAEAGWQKMFQAQNKRLGKGKKKYKKGEKIAIKANINGSGVFDDDRSGRTKMSYTNPVLLKVLLTSLVTDAGVEPSDITVYDVSRVFPTYMVEMCTEGKLKGVRFVDRDNGIADKKHPIQWSYSFSGAVNYLPTCVTQAEYVINFANLKGHSYGITLCGKNHFGSFITGMKCVPRKGLISAAAMQGGNRALFMDIIHQVSLSHRTRWRLILLALIF